MDKELAKLLNLYQYYGLNLQNSIPSIQELREKIDKSFNIYIEDWQDYFDEHKIEDFVTRSLVFADNFQITESLGFENIIVMNLVMPKFISNLIDPIYDNPGITINTDNDFLESIEFLTKVNEDKLKSQKAYTEIRNLINKGIIWLIDEKHYQKEFLLYPKLFTCSIVVPPLMSFEDKNGKIIFSIKCPMLKDMVWDIAAKKFESDQNIRKRRVS